MEKCTARNRKRNGCYSGEGVVMKYKHKIKVIFEDGDYFFTKINDSEEEIKEYYIGKIFNIGTLTDNMKRCVDVEFLN